MSFRRQLTGVYSRSCCEDFRRSHIYSLIVFCKRARGQICDGLLCDAYANCFLRARRGDIFRSDYTLLGHTSRRNCFADISSAPNASVVPLLHLRCFVQGAGAYTAIRIVCPIVQQRRFGACAPSRRQPVNHPNRIALTWHACCANQRVVRVA